MALLAPSSLYSPTFPHRAAPFAAAGTPGERGLLLVAVGRHFGPTYAQRDAAPLPRLTAVDRRRCDCFDLHQQLVPFADARAWQDSIVERRKGLADRDKDHSDTLIVLQHPPVFTLGNGATKECLHFDEKDPPFELHRVKRAGKATYHGPGQLVMYPILNLRYHGRYLNLYLRSLEEVIIRALQSAFSIKASRQDGLTGVFIGDQKVASIGIHTTFPRYITCQGVALNVATDLSPFQLIVPCGIKDCRMGSVKEILQNASDGGIDETSLMDKACNSLIKEFAEAFNLSLDLSPRWNFQQSNDDN